MISRIHSILFPGPEEPTWKLMIVGALCWVLSYPPFNLSFLAPGLLLPVFAILTGHKSHLRKTGEFYLYLLLAHSLTLYWICFSTFAGGVLAILVNPVFMLFPVLIWLLTHQWVSRRYQLFYLGCLWIGFEYLLSLWELAFPWMLLGHSQFLFSWVLEWASAGGVWLVSFFVFLSSWWLWESGQSHQKTGNWSRSYLMTGLAGFLFIMAGGWLLSLQPVQEDGSVRAAVIQPNVDPWAKWDGDNEYQNLVQLTGMTRKAAETDSLIQLAIWPETAVSFYLLADRGRFALDDIRLLSAQTGIQVATGYPHVTYFDDSTLAPPSARYSRIQNRYYLHYNAATLIDSGRSQIPYGKMMLVPFAERVPWVDSVPFMKDLRFNLAGLGGWGKGQDTVVFALSGQDSIRFPLAICYESAFPHLIREFTLRGATVLAVITNDGWWGHTSGYSQHFEFSRLRAIENRRWVIRSANNGISGFIDPHGKVIRKSEFWTDDILIETAGLSSGQSLFMQWGHWVPVTLLILGFLLIPIALFSRLFVKATIRD
ncbi:MAG: apolipoprotein N-acyltransferase [Bacteroidetes bacterium]|nr:apolipoprotein N-acyltransferase [Bacteroidota bacterium]